MGGRVIGSAQAVGSIEELVANATGNGLNLRTLPAPPFMHGAAHWASFMILHQGGTVCIQDDPRSLDPDDVWRTIEREKVVTLSIVGDAFARPLLDQLQRGKYDVSSLKVIGSGGAIFSLPLKKAFLEAHVKDKAAFDKLSDGKNWPWEAVDNAAYEDTIKMVKFTDALKKKQG